MGITKVKPFVFPVALFAVLCLVAFAQALAQGGRFAIQLGASPDRTEAEAKLKEAQAQNLDAYLVKSKVPGKGVFYRIRVGNYASRAAAERAARQFVASGALGEHIISIYETSLALTTSALTKEVAPTPAPARDEANSAAKDRLFAPPKSSRPAPTAANSAQTTPGAAKPSGIPAKAPVRGTCDDLAAHPEDKGRVGAGVADDKIAPGLAIDKCALAVRQSPGVARFHFQLGRTYWAAKLYDEALDAFLKAEEMNYAPAYFYIAQAYEQGLIEGETADPATARDFYLLAASGGFEPAARAYAEFEEVYEIVFSDFEKAAYIEALYTGKITTRAGEIQSLNEFFNGVITRRDCLVYLEGFQRFLLAKSQSVDASCAQVYDKEVSITIQKLLEASWDAGWPQTRQSDPEYRDDGDEDMHRLVVEYGGCQGSVVTRIYANVKRYLQEHPLQSFRGK